MNRTRLAEFFGVAMPTVDSWIRAGCPYVQRGTRGHEWQFDVLAVIEWKYRYQPEQDPDKMTPSQRNAWYQGSVLKNRLEELDTGLVEIAEVRDAIAAAFRVIKEEIQKIVDSMPAECRPAVASLLNHGVEEMHERLTIALNGDLKYTGITRNNQ
jgi:phage terminase Nu1 subunit (DNA packaging protein)